VAGGTDLVPLLRDRIVEADAELAHRNNVMGLALFGLFLLIFGGTFLIAFIYLAVD
jgi:hypothetical protein